MTQNDYQFKEETEILLSKKAIYPILAGLSLLALSAFFAVWSDVHRFGLFSFTITFG